MTAGAMRGDRERSLAVGMNDYLAKPVAIEVLKRTVELWLRRSPIRQCLLPGHGQNVQSHPTASG